MLEFLSGQNRREWNEIRSLHARGRRTGGAHHANFRSRRRRASIVGRHDIPAGPPPCLRRPSDRHLRWGDKSVLLRIIKPREIQSMTAWVHGDIEFDDQPSSGILSEFARYRPLSFSSDDPSILNIRFSGTFHTSDVDLVLRILRLWTVPSCGGMRRFAAAVFRSNGVGPETWPGQRSITESS